MKQRNLIVVALLTLFLPIYDLILIYDWQNARHEEDDTKMSGAKMITLLIVGFLVGLILSLVIVGIFVIIGLGIWLIIWHYQFAKEVSDETGNESLPIIALLGTLFFPPVSYVMIQNEINENL